MSIYIKSQNANNQAQKSTHNCTMWMCPHDANCRNETGKKIGTLILQFIMQKIQEQNREKTSS